MMANTSRFNYSQIIIIFTLSILAHIKISNYPYAKQ